ncbi:MAG: glycosyltransferase family 4 protein, partial [Bacteroidota bacterium]
HLRNYLNLVRNYFDEVLVVSDHAVDFAPCEQVSFSLKNPYQVLKSIRQLKNILRDYQPSIIHVHQANSYAFIAGKANVTKIPLVLTAWGSDVLILPNKSPFHRWLVKQGLQSAQVLTADSKEMVDAIRRLGIKTEVVQANFGVDLVLSAVPSSERPLVFYSNRMHEPLYRIDEIIEGMGEYFQSSDGEMIIAGKGSMTEALQEKVHTLGIAHRVRFVGFIDATQNRALYLGSRFFLSLPQSDGTSISLLEAMAYGCMPIVSDLPSNREWVEDNVNGIILQKGETLKNAVLRGIQLQAADVILRNRNIVKTKATKAVNSRKFTLIYDAIFRSATRV